MSQSKSAYGVQEPKDVARERRHRQANSNHKSVPEPACWRHSASDWEWYEAQFTAAYRKIHDPCSDCFASGPPDVSEFEAVIRSRSYPVKYHRPRDTGDETESSESPLEATNRESQTATRFAEAAIDARKPISSITELKEGDGVLWQDQSTPMLVVGVAAKPDGRVRLRGPNGGKYQIEGRPECQRSYYIRPGYSCQKSISRVASPRAQSEGV